MSLNSYQSLQRGKLHRGLALILLVFAFTDLVFIDIFTAQPCIEISSGVEAVSRELISNASLAEARTVSLGSPVEHDRDAESGADEDCFCCCSSVLHGVSHDLAQLNEPKQPADSMPNSLPLSLPNGLYHPPRA